MVPGNKTSQLEILSAGPDLYPKSLQHSLTLHSRCIDTRTNYAGFATLAQRYNLLIMSQIKACCLQFYHYSTMAKTETCCAANFHLGRHSARKHDHTCFKPLSPPIQLECLTTDTNASRQHYKHLHVQCTNCSGARLIQGCVYRNRLLASRLIVTNSSTQASDKCSNTEAPIFIDSVCAITHVFRRLALCPLTAPLLAAFTTRSSPFLAAACFPALLFSIVLSSGQ